jgi:hypothetical protein
VGYLKPWNPAALGCILQRILQIRFAELLDGFERPEESAESEPKESVSIMRTQSLLYIKELKNYKESGQIHEYLEVKDTNKENTKVLSETGAQTCRQTNMLAESCVAFPSVEQLNTLKTHELFDIEILYPLQDTDISFILAPSLLGYYVSGLARKDAASGSWKRFKPNLISLPQDDNNPDAVTQAFMAAYIPIAAGLGMTGSLIREKELLDLLKEKMQVKYPGSLKPDIETLCAAIREITMRQLLCLVDLKWLIEEFYGEKLGEAVRGDGTEVGGYDEWILKFIGVSSNEP